MLGLSLLRATDRLTGHANRRSLLCHQSQLARCASRACRFWELHYRLQSEVPLQGGRARQASPHKTVVVHRRLSLEARDRYLRSRAKRRTATCPVSATSQQDPECGTTITTCLPCRKQTFDDTPEQTHHFVKPQNGILVLMISMTDIPIIKHCQC